ncbi:hypothetical protein PV326_014427, partial [Microctonus aethiopoides]
GHSLVNKNFLLMSVGPFVRVDGIKLYNVAFNITGCHIQVCPWRFHPPIAQERPRDENRTQTPYSSEMAFKLHSAIRLLRPQVTLHRINPVAAAIGWIPLDYTAHTVDFGGNTVKE